MRQITYAQAINEALSLMLARRKDVYLIGQGVTSPWYVGSTTKGLVERFGKERVIDTPVSENAVTGAAVGSAIAGMRPVVVHPRMDFMYLALDQIANHAANWHYMFGGCVNVPITIWGIVNRGGEQAAQHSQALQALFAQIPGLKVVMPSTPHDAKGLFISAILDGNPVVVVDERWLYNTKEDVPKDVYTVPIGKAAVRKRGRDVTVAAMSYLVGDALTAAKALEEDGVSVEVIDIRTAKPLDWEAIRRSVTKTGRLVIADTGWSFCSISSEIAARAATSGLAKRMKHPVIKISLPDLPAPASRALEKAYYKGAKDIIKAVRRMFK